MKYNSLIIVVLLLLQACHKNIKKTTQYEQYTNYIYQGDAYKSQNIPKEIKSKMIVNIKERKYNEALSNLLNNKFQLSPNSSLCTTSLIELQFDSKINYKMINEELMKFKKCPNIAINLVIKEGDNQKMKYIDHNIYFIIYLSKNSEGKYDLFIINSNINQYESYKIRLLNLCNNYLRNSVKISKIYKVITTNRNFNIDNIQYDILNLIMIIDNHRLRFIKPLIERYSKHRYIDNFLIDILN